MNLDLPDLAAEFGAAADKAMTAAGSVDLARRAEADPTVRAEAQKLLDGLGVADLDPRRDLETAAAAGELCRAAGRHALPYPVVAYLLRDADGRPLTLAWRTDHATLFPAWRIAAPGQPEATIGRPAHGALASKLAPFTGDLEPADLEPADLGTPTQQDPTEIGLHLTLTAWRVLGTVERAVEAAVEHVGGREQFGQRLSQFQAVQFALADAAVARDGLQQICHYSLWRLFEPDAGARVEGLTARLQALDAARATLRTTQQLFGAAGVCDEYDISILIRHIQPDLRLPFGAERTAAELFEAIAREGFDSLFRHGGAL